jgi:hypothetical protein
VLSVVTKARLPIGEVSCRQSAQSSPHGANFTTSMQVGAAVSQVQGIETPTGGWQLVVADDAGVRESEVRSTEVRLTTLDLLDPGRTRLLAEPGHIGILIAETGRIVEGDLSAGTPTVMKIGGKPSAATHYTLQSNEGKGDFYVGDDGLLLRSEIDFLGGAVSTILRQLPEARTFGNIDAIDSPSAGVQEADL